MFSGSLWFIDFPTLVLVLIGGLLLGVQGIFGLDILAQYLGPAARLIQAVIGIAAVWQFSRQKFS
jgi:uncharacterized membrane protein YuzA (DUF378 family)